MLHELLWMRNPNNLFEIALDKLPPKVTPESENLRWSRLVFLQLKGNSILVEPTTGSWVALSPQSPSITAAKKLIGSPASLSPDLASFLFRRNIITDNFHTMFYPPTIETPAGHNLPVSFLFVVETTERCNLRCLYCSKSISTNGIDMTEELAHQVVKYIAAFRKYPVFVDFSGGEPTLNLPVIQIIVSELKKKIPGVHFSIQTNATLITEDVIKLAHRYHIRLGSSLEGSTDNLRELRPFANGKDASYQILKGIHKLKMEKLLGGAVSSFNNKVDSDPDLFLDMLQQVGLSSVKLNLCAPLGRWAGHEEDVKTALSKYYEYIKHLVDEGISRVSPIRESITSIIAERILNRIPGYRCSNSPCDAGFTFQNIRVNGDIFPCDRYSRFPDLCLGNIASVLANRDDNLLKVESSVTDFTSTLVLNNKTTDLLNRRTTRSIAVCSRCSVRSFCGSGCGMESYCKFGSFDQPSAQCEFYKRYIPQVFDWLINSSRFRNVYYPDGCEEFRFQLTA